MYSIGIDLGGTNIAVGLCDENLTIIDKDSTPTLPKRESSEIVEDMARLTAEIVKRNGLTLEDITGVGIVAPGSTDTELGVVEYTNNLPFRNFPLVEAFKKHLPVKKVAIANDADAAALGEALAGAAKGAKSLVMITIGTGIGGGVIINGKILDSGVNSATAELGHTVIHTGGRQCSCGRRGCWEAYSSATALTDMTREKMTELELKGIPSLLFDEAKHEGKVSAKTAFSAMKRGDKHAAKLVDDYIYYLAAGITNVINIFQPEILSIGGGVCNEREYLTRPLIEIVEREQYARDSKRKTKIVTATLGNDAGIVGAAGLGR